MNYKNILLCTCFSALFFSEWIVSARTYAEVVRGVRDVSILNIDTAEEDSYYYRLLHMYDDTGRDDPRERSILCTRRYRFLCVGAAKVVRQT